MITVEILAKLIKPNPKEFAEKYVAILNKAMARYGINTPLRQAHFLAQVLHESGRLRYCEEIASGAAYEGRKDLGNTQKGDGRRFKGRGLIQLTGRSNYTAYKAYIGLDVVSYPNLVAKLPLSVDVAGWFWTVVKDLNPLADADDVRTITKRINGGLNGYEDRKKLLALAKKLLNV